MTYGNLNQFPAAVQACVQDGILARELQESLKPVLAWRQRFMRERHPGNVGDRVTKSRLGLFTPLSRTTAQTAPGVAPPRQTRGLEQYGYQVQNHNASIDIVIPSGFIATGQTPAAKFMADLRDFGFHAGHSVGRWARDVLYDAYAGGDTFATAAGSSSTSIPVADLRGLGTVLVNGVPTAVSVTNPLTATLGSTSVSITAVSGSSGTGTVTLASAATWSQYDRLKASNAPTVIRQNSRATDRLIVSGDTPTMATFRRARTVLVNNNVPGIDGAVGGTYGVYLDSDTKDALIVDSEFLNAIQSQGITGPSADGRLATYGGMAFFEQPRSEMPGIDSGGSYQTDIHQSLVFGQDVGIEGFIPEDDFAAAVPMEGIGAMNHIKIPIDPDGALAMIIRAPLDEAGRVVSCTWTISADWCIPSDVNNLTGNARYKRAVIVKTAGPAFT